MESAPQRFNRLVSALETLIECEATSAASGDFAAVAEAQRQAEPVVNALAAMEPDAADAAARARLANAMARRQHSIDLLGSRMETARAELEAIESTGRRAAKLGPVYGSAARHPGSGYARLSAKS